MKNKKIKNIIACLLTVSCMHGPLVLSASPYTNFYQTIVHSKKFYASVAVFSVGGFLVYQSYKKQQHEDQARVAQNLKQQQRRKLAEDLKTVQELGNVVQEYWISKLQDDSVTPYQLLGVRENATSFELLRLPGNASKDTVKKAYHALSRQWHPDKSPVDNRVFQIINEAYKKCIEHLEAAEQFSKIFRDATAK